jgi:hypothetical protein
MKKAIQIFLAASVVLITSSGAINIIGYDPAINDIENVSTDFSGVGLTSTNRWGTLIHPNIIISASHWTPSNSITFFSGESRNILWGQSVAGSDIWLGVLDTPVENSTVYPYMTKNVAGASQILTNESVSGVLGWDDLNLTMLGFINGETKVAYGDAHWFLQDGAASAVAHLRQADAPAGSGVLTGGDSGSPGFANIGGIPTLIGTGWQSDRVATTYWSYTGNAVGDISQFIAENGEVLSTPEPSRTMLMMLGALGLISRRRR